MNKILCFCILIQISLTAMATELVILESTATDYIPGQTITDDESIDLVDGAEVILLSEDGIVIAVVGPFTGPLVPLESEDDYDILRTLGVLVGQSEVDSRSIGGVRAGAGGAEVDPIRDVADSRDSPWAIHTGIGGVQCLPASSETIDLWREEGTSNQRIHIVRFESDDTASADWDAGRRRAEWPAGVPAEFDALYVLRKDDERRSVALVMRAIPDAVVDNDYATVAWLAARGCTSQARLVFNGLR